jgi:hypothetical protein
MACASIDPKVEIFLELNTRTAEIKRYLFGIKGRVTDIKRYHDTPFGGLHYFKTWGFRHCCTRCFLLLTCFLVKF